MFIKLLFITILLIILAVIGLAVSIIFSKKGRFPETHVDRNKEMRKRGITCAKKVDIGCHSTDDFPGCVSCSSRLS
jgi:hypothetical protein